MRKARPSAGLGTRSSRPEVSSRATRRETPPCVNSASPLSSVIRRPSGCLDSAYSTPYSLGLRRSHTSATVSSWATVACARNSASQASFAMRVRLAIGSADERELGHELRVRVLIGRGAGHVVTAVRVRARLPRFGVAVLRPDQARMRRRVRHARRAARLHLLAQRRHHLGAEQLDLLQRLLERQAHRIDDPQLALVVAEALLEAERL